MDVEASLQMYLTFGVVIVAIAAYSYDRIPLEISGLTSMAILLVIFTLFPLEDADRQALVSPRGLLAGFGDPALVTIMALLVVGQGLIHTGALAGPAQMIVTMGRSYPRLTVVLCLVIVALTSAVLNNTPVVVMFIPILAALADRIGQSTAKVMIPLSFAAILGGNLTIIGSSTNLLAIGAYQNATSDTVSFFDFTVPGLVIAAVGLFYVSVIAPRLLNDNGGMAKQIASSGGKQFLFQVEIAEDSKMAGQTSTAGLFPGLKDMTIRMIERGRDRLLPPYDGVTLLPGDIILAAATRSVMTDLMNASPDLVTSAEGDNDSDGDEEAESNRRVIAEAIVAPASRMDGRTLAMTGFRSETGCSVLGIQRRSRMIRAAMSQLRIEAGDVLLVMGSRANVLGLRGNRDVILLESSADDVPMTAYSGRAALIFAGIVALASSGLLPIAVTALIGAVSMLIMGCLNVRQASRAIDRRVFVIVGSALAMGAAMQATDGAQWIAKHGIDLLYGAGPAVVLSGFFLLVAVLTNILSNNATAVLFTPVAVSIASELGVDPLPFLLAVIFGANTSFATPMSYQTNLLVMAPGHYRFTDFLRTGTPLIFICWLTFTIFVPWYYGLL